MQQLITSARRTTTGALKTGKHQKRALRKPLVTRTRWIEKKEKHRSRSNRHPCRRRNGKLSSSVSGDVNKMKIRHDLPSRVRNQAAFCFFSFLGGRLIIFRSSADCFDW